MLDEDNETESAGQDLYEGSTVGTMMETLDTDLLQRQLRLRHLDSSAEKHFCASTDPFSSRYTRSRSVPFPLNLSRPLCFLFLAVHVAKFLFIVLNLGHCAASRVQSTTAECVFVLTHQLYPAIRAILRRLLEAAGATPLMMSQAIMMYCIL